MRSKSGGSRSPIGYLESLSAPDGSVRYSRTSAQTPVWVTAEALAALAGKPFPSRPPDGRAVSDRAYWSGPSSDSTVSDSAGLSGRLSDSPTL